MMTNTILNSTIEKENKINVDVVIHKSNCFISTSNLEDLPTIVIHYIFLFLQVGDLLQCRLVSKLLCEIAAIAVEDTISRLCRKYYPFLLYHNQDNQHARSALRSAIPRPVTYFRRGIYTNNFSLLRELSSHRIIIARAFIVYSLPLRNKSPDDLNMRNFKRCHDTSRDRGGFCSVTYKGEVYVIGTYSIAAAGTVEKYNFVADKWSALTPLPRRFRSLSAAVVKISGNVETSTERLEPSYDAWYHNSSNNKSRLYSKAKTQRVTVRSGEYMYVTGGVDVTTTIISDEVYLFQDDRLFDDSNNHFKNTTTRKACSSSLISASSTAHAWIKQDTYLIYPRYRHASAFYKGKIWISGGSDEYEGVGLKSVEIYDPISGYNSLAPSMNCRRAFHNLLVVQGKLYAVGGNENDVGQRIRRTIEVFEDEDGASDSNIDDSKDINNNIRKFPGAGTWKHVADFVDERIGFSACAHGPNIYIFSGSLQGEFEEQRLDTWDYFNVELKLWHSQMQNSSNKYMPLIDSWGQSVVLPDADSICWTEYS